MNRLELAAARYVEARKRHQGQGAAWRALHATVTDALRERFPRLPHVDVPPTFGARLRAAWRVIIGEAA